ncbi:MAG: hypothetical protein HQK77_11935 [Desulfobacterales bacterium]|nr:hypothetical protein [Desulfobacterales bacterium]
MDDYRELKPRSKLFKKIYIAIMLWFVGRSIQAASRVDKDIKKEFDDFPEGFTFSLGVAPNGPYMVVGKDKQGKVKYLGWNRQGKRIDVDMKLKNIEAAFLLFTFQESTCRSSARNRLIVDGDVPTAAAIVRVIDMVEVYLLPKLIAKLAIRRYPSWSIMRTLIGRSRIYFRAILGY